MELSSNLCLEASVAHIPLEMKACNFTLDSQRWNFTHYTPEYYRLLDSTSSVRYPADVLRLRKMYFDEVQRINMYSSLKRLILRAEQ